MTPAEKGRMGEELAAALLEQREYRILARNFHRRSGAMVSEAETITPSKRKKLVLAA